MKLKRTYKYRMYPSFSQKQKLNKTFGCVRFLWNKNVETFNSYDKEDESKPIYKTSTEFRNEYDFLKEVSASAIQQKEKDFKQYKSQKFNQKRKVKIGKPSFKSKYYYNKFRLPNQKFNIVGGKIRLEKIGEVKFDNHREVPENAKLMSITVSRDLVGDFYCSINFEYEKTIKKEKKEKVGIDLGISRLATLSDGIAFENPRYFDNNQAELGRLQKQLSRKKKGSNRRRLVKSKVTKIHQKTARQREWYLHNVSKFVAENYGEIGMEDLNVGGMMKGKRFSKSLADASMSKLKTFITYKSEAEGYKSNLLGRFEPSTIVCCKCSNKQEMKLSDRVFDCEKCNNVLDRDLNASINIRNKTVGVNTETWTSSKSKPHALVKFSNLYEA